MAILLFPMERRRALVEKLAQQMLARCPAAADKHLAIQLRRQGNVMQRRGLSEPVIDAQLRGFEVAVRTELWRLVMYPRRPSGGAA